ncbi:MlaD family protein [Aldersonia kunmingensis]|uniref:MlaD family protein n=1 Tax=Aldersonia kunmingensis TaxID=408066 RepID=UPI000830F9DE|nr:MlaD family protein [Aldersonia kunmingensis]
MIGIPVRRLGAAVGVALVALLSACSVQPTDLPLPGTRVSGESYELGIEFGSVLNLPARSKVLMNGSRIGVLRDVAIAERDGRRVALATVDLQADVQVPADSTAELKQATVLGDFYIALTPPAGAFSAMLADKGVIPLAQTTVSPQVEDLLGGIAALANGGTLEKMQRAVENANRSFPVEIAERDHGVEVLRALVARLAGEQDSLNEAIDSVSQISTTLDTNASKLAFSFDVGPERVSGAVSAFLGLSNVLKALGANVVPIGDLVIPRQETLFALIDVVEPLVATATRLDTTLPEDIAKLDRILADQVGPLVANPSVNIVDITTDDGRPDGGSNPDRTAAVAAVLRMIGAMR